MIEMDKVDEIFGIDKSDTQLKSELLFGMDIDVGEITLRNYKLGEIIKNKNFGLNKYYRLVNLSLLETKDLFQNCDENILKYNPFELSFILQPIKNLNLEQWFTDFLNTFTYDKWICNKNVGMYMSPEKRLILKKDDMDDIFKIFKKVYCVGKNKNNNLIDPSMAVDEETKELAKEFAELEKEKLKNKKFITLNGIIGGVCSTSNSYSFFNVENLTIYQLMYIFYANDAHENYNHLLQGGYSGTIDMKKIKIENMHYCNEIDV